MGDGFYRSKDPTNSGEVSLIRMRAIWMTSQSTLLQLFDTVGLVVRPVITNVWNNDQ